MADRRSDLTTVQALRAIAALLVVTFHAVDSWGHHVLGRAGDELWPNGAAGVDVFFVISGMVMVVSANRLAGRLVAWRICLRQRFTWIVPLYWILPTAKLVVVLIVPALVVRTRLDWSYVIGSYLYLPVHDSMGHLWPLLPVGWTLT